MDGKVRCHTERVYLNADLPAFSFLGFDEAKLHFLNVSGASGLELLSNSVFEDASWISILIGRPSGLRLGESRVES